MASSQKAAELPSLLENDGYFVNCSLNAVIVSLYDPDGTHAHDPLCWPHWAERDDLIGLPPHVISVDELDVFRDEGLAYHRKLAGAGVQISAKSAPSRPVSTPADPAPDVVRDDGDLSRTRCTGRPPIEPPS